MRRKHAPPVEFAGRRAKPDDLKSWSVPDRNIRTCFHCRTTYATSADATRCEQLHEAADDRARDH
ncbi:hypothetical protein [Amycolatopsis cihanbeyliensis]|uniref:C2H2-type domain-containing protein n=1 Tax=Amycolatopsis cihanbeyliensis TaxID=1128664 RepID=A0A542DHT5_AMYCI|nr:hypothetical protein [Amycolatopsis cihanbeyliensis]TQJ02594.1 hypothetical protein FB471_2327 [Amycolatopsis cihanbeyliensis]